MKPTVYIAITDHGFGHATRTAAVVAEIQRQCQAQGKQIDIIITTTAPRWLLEEYISGEFIYRQRSFDVGVIQADSLQVDRAATFAKIQSIRDRSATIIAEEVAFLHANHVGLIIADIPPLVASIAAQANIPCWMVSNFGWDWIYRDWGGEFIEMADWIAELYGQSDRLFRLPFHESMSAFSQIQDVGLTGGYPRYAPAALRQKLGLIDRRPTALLTFGGLSLSQIPYHNLTKFPDWQFVTFDRDAPDLPNLTRISKTTKLRPVDLMVVCDRLITKPGYSTLSEACRVQIPIVCLTREGFVEAKTLIAGVENYAEHLIISPAEFYTCDWSFLLATLEPPKSAVPLDRDGETTIAAEVIAYLCGI